jgi:Trypsin
MKLFIVLACLAGALAFEFDPKEIDHENLIPVYETVEWKAANPDMVKQVESLKPYKHPRNGRIWGGRLANPGELPYQVGIVVLLSRQAFCGGSIVSANFVLSAAGCFPGDPNAVVEIGSVDRNTVPEFINAAEKILHPAFDVS